MKNIYILVFIITNTLVYSQSWIELDGNTTKNLWGVSFINQNTGLVCGDSGTILKTNNSGVDWTPVNTNNIQFNFNAINYITLDTAYAISWIDKGGKIVKTTDGGTNWTDISLNRQKSHCGGTWFFNGLEGILAVGDSNYSHSKILHTINGGNSWDTLYNSGSGWISFFYFADRSNGYATVSGSKVLKTTDGGNNWTLINVDTNNLWMSGIYFFDKDNGYVGGGDYSNGGGAIYKTTDGGNNWQYINSSFGSSVMHFTSPSTCYSIGSTSYWDNKKIYKSTDSCENWLVENTPKYRLNDLIFINNNIGFAVGDTGVILKLDIASSISTLKSNIFSLPAPNPTELKTSIHINSIFEEELSVTIYNSQAQIINANTTIEKDKIEFDLSNQNSGLYHFKISNKENVIYSGNILLVK